MPKKIGAVDRTVLTSAALPQATSTYTVISHSYVINTIMQALDDNGFTVKEEVYRCTTDAKVAHGSFIINYENDPELELMYSFSNSYDKSLRFRAAVGAHVPANDGFIISEMDNWRRKHTGTADNETETLINEHIAHAKEYFAQLVEDKEAMKLINVDKSSFGSIIGQLFLNGYLGIDQLSMVAKEYENPTFTYTTGKDNLWTCYCHLIAALRQSHPSKWMQNQVAVHLFLVAKYNLTQFDEDETTEENGPSDTVAVQDSPTGGVNQLQEGMTLPGFEHLEPQQIHVESDQEYVERVAEIEGEPEEKLAEAMVEPLKSDIPLPLTEANLEELPQKEEPVKANWEVVGETTVLETNEDGEPLVSATPIVIDYSEEIVDEVLAENNSEEESVNSYIFQDDYPGLSIGDVVEIEEVYFEILAAVPSEDGDLFECKEADVEEMTEAIAENDNAHQDVLDKAAEEASTEHHPDPVELEEEVLPIVNPDDEVEETSSLEKIEEEEVEEPVNDLDAEEDADWSIMKAKEVEYPQQIEEEPEVMEPDPDVEEAEMNKNDPIYKAIENELEEIYGYQTNFTYTESGTQYNIVLESGESIVLSTAYIQNMVN
jgi:hypothetical protein